MPPETATTLSLVFQGAQLVGVAFLAFQIFDAHRWRKKESHYNFADVGDGSVLQERLYSVLARAGAYGFPERCVPLAAEYVDALANDAESTFVLNSFLNYLQNVCTAYDLGLVSERSFTVVHAGRIVWWYRILLPYVERRRIDYANPDIWNVFTNSARKRERHFPLPAA